MTKATKYRDLTVVELKAGLIDLNKEHYNLVNEMRRTKKLEKPHLLRQTRKERARLLTILHEKQSVRT